MSIIWLLFVLICLVGAASDVLTFRIPNAIVIALLLLFALAACVALIGHAPVPWFNHLAAGALSLAVGLVLYGFRQMGAGDAKLLAVVALWAGLSGLIPLLFALALSGLVALLVILLLRRVLHRRAEARPNWENPELPRVLRTGEGIPYGVGIVAAAILASGTFPAWLWKI